MNEDPNEGNVFVTKPYRDDVGGLVFGLVMVAVGLFPIVILIVMDPNSVLRTIEK